MESKGSFYSAKKPTTGSYREPG